MSRTHPRASDADTARFNAMWEGHASRVLAYAFRHTDREAAQEVVSETFLVAWRRLADIPDDPLPWLLVVARNTIANQLRADHRRDRLHHEAAGLQRTAATHVPGTDEVVEDRADVLTALEALSPKEREALLLIAWDGLAPADAARVAGCSIPTFQVRLFRARRRLEGARPTSAGHGACPDLSLRSTT